MRVHSTFSGIFIQKGMTISLSFSVRDSKDHNRKIWIQNYKILSFIKYTTKQLCLSLFFTLVEHGSSGIYFYWNWSQRALFLQLFLWSLPFLQCSRIAWDSSACAVFCHDATLFLRLCSSPLVYCFVFLNWSNSSWPFLICWSLFCLFKPTTEVL